MTITLSKNEYLMTSPTGITIRTIKRITVGSTNAYGSEFFLILVKREVRRVSLTKALLLTTRPLSTFKL